MPDLTTASKDIRRGERLKEAREALTLTQQDVAERIGTTNVSVSNWENGANVSEDFLKKLADLFGVSRAWLRYGEELGRWPTDLPQNDARKAKLPPRAYERAYQYLEKLRVAGIPDDMVDESERLMTEHVYSKLNKRDVRERTEEDLIIDIDAAWSWIAEVIERKWGISV